MPPKTNLGGIFYYNTILTYRYGERAAQKRLELPGTVIFQIAQFLQRFGCISITSKQQFP